MESKSNADKFEEDARAKGFFQESEPGTAFILMMPREDGGDEPPISIWQRFRRAIRRAFRRGNT